MISKEIFWIMKIKSITEKAKDKFKYISNVARLFQLAVFAQGFFIFPLEGMVYCMSNEMR